MAHSSGPERELFAGGRGRPLRGLVEFEHRLVALRPLAVRAAVDLHLHEPQVDPHLDLLRSRRRRRSCGPARDRARTPSRPGWAGDPGSWGGLRYSNAWIGDVRRTEGRGRRDLAAPRLSRRESAPCPGGAQPSARPRLDGPAGPRHGDLPTRIDAPEPGPAGRMQRPRSRDGQSSLLSWIMGSSSFVLRSTASTMVRSSMPSALAATAGMIWRESGRLKRTVKVPSGRSWTGSPWSVTRAFGSVVP